MLISFFFLPWLKIFGAQYVGVSGREYEGNWLFIYGMYITALVPVAAVFTFVIERRGTVVANPQRYKSIGYVIAGVLGLIFYNGFFLLRTSQAFTLSGVLLEAGVTYSIGFWLALIASAGLVLQVFNLLDGLRGKLVVGFTLVFAVVFAVAYAWFFNFASSTANLRVREDLRSTLDGLVAGINGDDFRDLVAQAQPRESDGYTDDQRYWDHVNWFATVRDIEPRAIAYSYVLNPDDPNGIIYIGSVGATFDPPVGVTFKVACESCSVDDNLDTLNNRRITITDDITTDDYGSWITANAPIIDSNDTVVGAVGLDFDASYVLQIQQSILNSILVSFEITYIALFLLVYLMAGAMTNPLRKLASVAKLVGEGQYEKAHFEDLKPSSWRDEIDALTGVLAEMTQKIYKREETLKQQVKELKIEIDQVKAKQQIKEIVETEFFESIAAKAKDIRARTSRAGGTSET
ncbi:MAG: hypothetical protein U0694_01015 [Anaerolineae bacterium]